MGSSSREQIPETVNFFCELIENRFNILDTLQPIAMVEHTSRGFSGNLNTIPETLLPYIGSHQTRVNVGLNYETGPDDTFRLHGVELEPEDGIPVKLTFDGLATSVQINGEIKDFTIGDEPLSNTVRSLIPTINRGSVDIARICRSISDFSPEQEKLTTVRQHDIELRFLESETVDNSMNKLAITVASPHPCGKVVRLQSTISETLLKTSQGTDSHYNVDLSTDHPTLSIEEIFDGKNYHVERPTHYHTNVIQTALEQLMDEALARRTQQA